MSDASEMDLALAVEEVVGVIGDHPATLTAVKAASVIRQILSDYLPDVLAELRKDPAP